LRAGHTEFDADGYIVVGREAAFAEADGELEGNVSGDIV